MPAETEPHQWAAIVLAAGASSRFGSDKLAYPLEIKGKEATILDHSLAPWLTVFDVVHVVANAANVIQLQGSLAKNKAAERIRWLICAEAELGMGHSLAWGVKHTSHAAGWLVGLGDMPYLQSDTITAVRQSLLQGASIVAPYVDGKRGHPVGFGAQHRQALLELQGNEGAKHILKDHQHAIARIQTVDSGALLDIDNLQDLTKIGPGPTSIQ